VARHLGVYPRKGVIQKGADADLAIIDMKERRSISEDYPVYSKMGYSPYEGVAVQGVPIRTIVRGKTVMENGNILGKKGYGKYVSPTK
jgi:dihydroorotase-like cyclic amidohydrolase